MADNSEEKHTKAQQERNNALKALEIAKNQDRDKIKNGAKFIPGPLRAMILKRNL